MYANTVGIDVWERLEVFHTLHLVFHLFYAKLAECSLLKCQAAMLAAAVVEAEHHVSLLCHPDVPTAHSPVARGVDVVGMWASIHVNHSRIALRGVEVGRQDEAVIDVGHTVGCLQTAHFHLGHTEAVPRFGSSEQPHRLAFTLSGGELDVACYGRRRVGIDHHRAALRELYSVPSLSVVELCDAAAHIHAEYVLLQRVYGIAGIYDALCLGVETHHIYHLPFALRQLSQLFALRVVEIDV